MVAVSARFLWIVAPGTSCLRAVPSKNDGIYIQCIVIKLKVAEESLVKWRKNIVIYCCIVLIEKALKGFTSSHLIKSPTLKHFFNRNSITVSFLASFCLMAAIRKFSYRLFFGMMQKVVQKFQLSHHNFM